MTQESQDPVLLDIDDAGIAWLRFNRPAALNAISVALSERLLTRVRELQAARARVVVLSGEGRAFMAGGDLQAFHAAPQDAPDTARAMIAPLHAALHLLAQGDAPVIASLHGAVAGAGMSLALGADLALAADDVKFTMAYSRIATSPDGGGSWHLPRLVGLRRALEIALLSDLIDAPTALQLGLVNRVVPREQLADETRALAQRLAQGPTGAFGATRRLLREAASRTLTEHLDVEENSFARCAATADFREGIAAFFERRPGRFGPT